MCCTVTAGLYRDVLPEATSRLPEYRSGMVTMGAVHTYIGCIGT